MGELKADTVVTMHVIVRPTPAGKPQGERQLPNSNHVIIQWFLHSISFCCQSAAFHFSQTSSSYGWEGFSMSPADSQFGEGQSKFNCD